MPGLKERAKNLVELVESARFLYADRPIALDDKAKALLSPEACAILAELMKDLAAVEPWTAAATENAVRAFAERKEVKLGAIAQPLRAALTGRPTSPGIFDVLQVLGKQESLARLADQARHAG
jgi:glutamyl-tRNA synthetase